MNVLLYLFGSGLAFFVGVGMVLASLGLFWLGTTGWRASVTTILALAGLAVIALSAAPLSYWVYGLAAIVSLVWLVAERWEQPWVAARRSNLRLATVVVWLGAAVLELPYHFSPRIAPTGSVPLYVIGDSVSAGAGSGEDYVWPDRLPVEVRNLAQPGATARSALQQAERLPPGEAIVVVEIGGNDLLSGRPAARFERDLDHLLKQSSGSNRKLIMFELPLPPLYNEYGRVQRRLAARHGVSLIPKRVLMGVLAGDGATLDSIHLSPSGHEQLAEAVWHIVEPAYVKGPAPSR